ncbi:hypothetical protein Scep_019738 [Stephania cephalantha]|uniref:RNase H type-1 domain-containing protein n=1 Tax=Stephania cephalantha TaxID=152367 RepID=A0AAP0IB82_9MAGN
MISPTGPSSSNHTPHSNHSGSSSRNGTPSPTISDPPSTASPAPSGRYGALMHELRAVDVRPDFVTNEAWNRYREYWASEDFKARSKKAPDRDEDDEVTPNDIFFHGHTKDHDGVTFIDNRSALFHVKLLRRHEEHTQATPNRPIDEKQLYYDAAGECSKGRVYGLGSLAERKRRYEDPGASTSWKPMVRSSELDAVVQRLKQFEAFVQSKLGMRMDFEQAPFRHQRRHHLRSIISRLGWIRLVHHSSSTTMMMMTTMIGWMRSTLPFDVLILNTDGASKGNPWSTTFGRVFRNGNGHWQLGYMGKIGHTSSLVAELWSIREGLNLAHQLQPVKLVIQSDSNTALQLITHGENLLHPAAALINDCQLLLRGNWEIHLKHVFREANQVADKLANLREGQSSKWIVMSSPPTCILPCLLADVMGVNLQH